MDGGDERRRVHPCRCPIGDGRGLRMAAAAAAAVS
jgi:hypothetical protein